MTVALMWHLHQPEYRDPRTGVPMMPWTRLHMLRGYRDLFVDTLRTNVPWTLNIVPGLLEQMLYYAGGGRDRHSELSMIPATDLTDAERREISQTFPCGNMKMRDQERYLEIVSLIESNTQLTTEQILDLQVLSSLVWTGATARADFPVFSELLQKGRGFSEADKTMLFASQAALLAEIPSLIRRIGELPAPCISTTPLHHPILPLLVDLQHAARSVRDPPAASFQWPGDAFEQLIRGKRKIEQFLGREVEGCWPSEGAVSPEAVRLIGEAGFRYFVSDEEILRRSRRQGEGEGGWKVEGIRGFFRDRTLSDRIGFDYATMEPSAAIDDFRGRAESEGIKVVALDGENPWEAFADAGQAFRDRLIAHLLTDGVSLDDACCHPAVGVVHQLHTGSWIGGNLEIWAGSSEDHEAWERLSEARSAVAASDTGQEEALSHLLAAEGSDWFWWYGPEFDTPFAAHFDAVFRGHIAAAYTAIDREIPRSLHQRIGLGAVRVFPPERPISPAEETWGGWYGAGRVVLATSSMARGEGSDLHFGWDIHGWLWLSIPTGVRRITIDGQPQRNHGVIRGPKQTTAVVEVDGVRFELICRDWVV